MNETVKKFLPIVAVVGVVWAAHKYGSPIVKGAAYGVAGFVALNQIPLVRDGLYARVMPTAKAA